MLSSKARILWIKWHAYLSCFFLPFALLIALTGILYLFDIKGGPSQEYQYKIATPLEFPLKEELGEQFIKEYFLNNNMSDQLPLPEHYFLDHDVQGWWDFHREIVLVPLENNQLKIIVETNGWWRQLLYIHKGIAGDLFVVFSILFGISLLFSLLSGTIVALVMPKLKRNAMVCMVAGFLALVMAYFVS